MASEFGQKGRDDASDLQLSHLDLHVNELTAHAPPPNPAGQE